MKEELQEIRFEHWACQRPLTKTWGSGQVWERICKNLGMPDVAFGRTDGIPDGITAVDLKTGYNWKDLPFSDNQFEFGYWDPPYYRLDKDGRATLVPSLYRPEGMEIWRTVKRIAILHTYVWPRAWLSSIAPAIREAMITVTMGPMKQVRMLQVFRKDLS